MVGRCITSLADGQSLEKPSHVSKSEGEGKKIVSPFWFACSQMEDFLFHAARLLLNLTLIRTLASKKNIQHHMAI